MRFRSALMMALRQAMEHRDLNLAASAVLFGVTEACIADLMRGKIDRFDLENFVAMASGAGLRVALRIKTVAAAA